MSGDNTQGVGAAAWAKAELVSAASAAAVKSVLENRIIPHPLRIRLSKNRGPSRFEQITNVIVPSI
jgi:hypothetical protein